MAVITNRIGNDVVELLALTNSTHECRRPLLVKCAN